MTKEQIIKILKEHLIRDTNKFGNTIYIMGDMDFEVIADELLKQEPDKLSAEEILREHPKRDPHNDIYGPGNDNYGRDKPLIPSPQHQVSEAIKYTPLLLKQVKFKTAEEILDLQQYVTNLLYRAYDEGRKLLNADEFDKYVEGQVELLEEFASQHKEQPTVPHWYTKEEMYNDLRNSKYSEEIAKELSEKYADDLQYAFTKGWEKAKYEFNKEQLKEFPDIDFRNDIANELSRDQLIERICEMNKSYKEMRDEWFKVVMLKEHPEVPDEEIDKQFPVYHQNNLMTIVNGHRQEGAKWMRDKLK